MGILGLLPFLKKTSKNTHVRNFSGSTAAVDGFGWLHKGAFGCAVKLGMGEPTDVYVNYFIKYINVLVENKIKPVVVFDGRSLPAKADTNKKRREKRSASRKMAQDMMRRGDKKGAWEHFVKAIEITHAMVLEVIKVLRQKHIDYIVAPYEADAQLAYLARNGFVDYVVTEDSDLVPFGCPKILFKLNANGDCVLFTQEKVHVCMDVPKNKYIFEHFRHMCILSGCDYLESLPKVGLTRAKKIIVALLTAPDGVVGDIIDAIRRIPSTLNLDVQVTEEYIQDFIDANNSFLYQLVFDPVERKVKPLNPYPEGVDKDEFSNAGTYDLSHEEFFQIAIGNINTKTLAVVGSYNIDKDRGFVNKDTSIWSKKFKALRLENGDDGPIVTTSTVLLADSAMVTANVKTKKKRPLASNAINSTEDDNAELKAIYGQETAVVSIDNDEEEEEEGSPTKQRSKRTRMSMISQNTVELRASKNPFGESNMSDEEQQTEEDLTTSVKGMSLRKRKHNPFLKSPDIGKRARARLLNSSSSEDGPSQVVKNKGLNGHANLDQQPICLIEKNRIYNIDAKLIVKSKYFRELAGSSSRQTNSSASSNYENEYSEVDTQLSIYSIDKDEVNFDSESAPENDSCPIELPGDNDAQETENNDAQTANDDAPTESNKAQVINLDDEEDYCSSYFSNPSKLNGVSKQEATIKKSPANTPPLTRAKANNKGSCRSQGLKRNSKKDSAQPSLQMFGFRAKPKI